MKEAHRSIWEYLQKKWITVLAFLVLAMVVHGLFFRFTSADLEIFLFDWFDYYDQVSIQEAFRNPISNYTGPYTYLLFISKLIQRGVSLLFNWELPDIVMIKLINIPFELLSVYAGMMTIHFYTKDERKLFYSFALLLFHPIVLINGAFWGQCDIIYTSFLLVSFLLLLYKKNFWAVFVFGIAFTFKFQAIFFSPLLLAFVLNRRLDWYCLAVVPLVYLSLHIPSMIAGRSLWNIIAIYFYQADSIPVLTANAPNLYQFIPNLSASGVVIVRVIGLTLTVVLAVWYAARAARHIELSDSLGVLLFACLVLILMPFVLPSMLDRYFFTAELFLLLFAIQNPKYWYLPLLITTASLFAYFNSYAVINIGLNAAPAKLGSVLNSLVLIIVFFLFFKFTKREPGQYDQVHSES